MAHVTAGLLAPVEAAFGHPAERFWTYPISEAEMAMVVSSTRGQTRLHDVTLFIFNQQGQIALIRKHNYPAGGWRAPGGGVHPGEDFVTGALREAWEETGLQARLTRYLLRVRVDFTCGAQVQPWTTHVLLAETDERTTVTRDSQEIADTRWGTLAELTGEIAPILLATGRGLFRYRVALHEEVGRLMALERLLPPQSST